MDITEESVQYFEMMVYQHIRHWHQLSNYRANRKVERFSYVHRPYTSRAPVIYQ